MLNIIRFLISVILVFMIFLIPVFAKVEVYNDLDRYNEFIGIEAKEGYKSKWGMDETIFPKAISDNMKIIDYKMVYYNPWDAQYLSYLVVDYNKDDYENEVKRLKEYNSTKYIGYYGVTGFSNYTLLAMYADESYGFVYAITDDKSRIIYVELIFCNYFYDLDYEKYIDVEYLPDGFDAKDGNEYQKIKSRDI